VEDADEFDTVLNGPVEDGVVSDGEVPKVRDIRLGTGTDLRVRCVELARLLEPGRESVGGLAAPGIEVVENPLQVTL